MDGNQIALATAGHDPGTLGRRVHPLTVQTLLLYNPVGRYLTQVQRVQKNTPKLVAEATELSPGVDHFKESSRALFASFGSSPTGLYSKVRGFVQ